jgi:hypothetical protein
MGLNPFGRYSDHIIIINIGYSDGFISLALLSLFQNIPFILEKFSSNHWLHALFAQRFIAQVTDHAVKTGHLQITFLAGQNVQVFDIFFLHIYIKGKQDNKKALPEKWYLGLPRQVAALKEAILCYIAISATCQL